MISLGVCLYCSFEYKKSRTDQKYCQRGCKDKAQAIARRVSSKALSREKKLIKRLTAFQKSSFGRWLIQIIKKHGTVQVLHGMTAQDLKELYDLKTACARFSGFNEGKPTGEYHLSHIFGAKGNLHSIGLLKASNLVIAPAKYNLSRLNSEECVDCRGESLPRNMLRDEFRCSIESTPTTVIKLITNLLKSEFEEFLLANTFKPGIHSKLLEEVRKYRPDIADSTSIERLQAIKSALGLPLHIPQGKPAPLVAVLAHEMGRFRLYDSPIFWVSYQISSKLVGSTHKAKLIYGDHEKTLARAYQHGLDILHQKREICFEAERYAIGIFHIPIADRSPEGFTTVNSPLDDHLLRSSSCSSEKMDFSTLRLLAFD